MNHKSAAFIALVAFCTGCFITLSIGFGLSRPMATEATAGNEYVQALHQNTARLDRIERAVTALTGAVGDTARAGANPQGRLAGALPSETALRQELARILREELRGVLAAVGGGEDGARAKEMAAAKVLNTPENIEAYAKAHDVVRVALAARRWTDEDAQDLRQALASLTDDQREEILQLLFPAINRGEIVVDTKGPPF